ncbi:MAG: carbon monoxide dehydrogenase [Oscillibacter sp.]|nr:carbon monoxide dehydrogenase [Oscillibacter sp.]
MNTCYIPNTLEELGEALGRLTENSLILAGGTDLVLRLRSKNLQPDALLPLGSVPALREIEITPERASIGAMATMAEIKKAVDGLPDLQALADAAGGVGSPQIRNKGTIGGNAVNASAAADLPPVLWLLNARVEIMGPGGALRTIPVQELPDGHQGNTLALGEAAVRFIIDRTVLSGWRSAFVKLGHRSQVTISRIGMAMALLQDEDGTVRDARVVAGAIKPVPFPLPAAEDILRGKKPDPALAIELGETFKGNTRRVYKENAAKGVFQDTLLRFQ